MYNRRQYVMLGQAQLSLRDVTDFTKKGVYQSSFMEKIKVRQLSEPALLLLSSLIVSYTSHYIYNVCCSSF